MKKLAKTFRKNGWNYTQLDRVGDVCLYQCVGIALVYEVFIVRKLKASILPSGRRREAREALPPYSKWGTQAWTLYTLERAQEKMALVLKARDTRKTEKVAKISNVRPARATSDGGGV